jgi:heme-degrading monooxygenase HmoA
MITVMATFVLAPEVEVAWEQVCERAAGFCRQQAGLRTARVFRDAHRPGRYLLHSEWESRAHVNQFVRRSGLLWLLRDADLFAEHPTIRYYDVVGDMHP